MRYLGTTIIIFLSLFVKGQNSKTLSTVSYNDTIKLEQAIIYGNFIQRLGFSSGGFPQDIRIINLDSKEIFTFRVKPTLKSAKENKFIFFIAPGNYVILNYWWTESKWYGGKIFTEPIYKGIDATADLEGKIKLGQISKNELVQFKFSINEKSLNYLGTWHFDEAIVSFTDEKKQLDKSLMSRFKKLDFASAKTVLPN